ncbi:lipocalin family protein [Flavobacteriaceae bacterium F89]|uniref:Lipocalin family protein n=1 Tax=Cerina litoralis TaxID=2874477 RepID=A0AAE3JQ02_9FLAO|nr:lipocalin family protein [Cerina litoralis]MCG2461581.1 lipocalin family protein [Cerina litoralis]
MKNIFLLTCACLLVFSCSNDDNNDNEEPKTSEIVGTWAVASSDSGSDANEAEASLKKIVEQLAGEGCPIITYTFDANGKVTVYNISEALSEEELQSGDVSCPASGAGSTTTGTYTYENGMLTLDFADDSAKNVSAAVTISGNTMKATVNDFFDELPEGVGGDTQVILTKS